MSSAVLDPDATYERLFGKWGSPSDWVDPAKEAPPNEGTVPNEGTAPNEGTVGVAPSTPDPAPVHGPLVRSPAPTPHLTSGTEDYKGFTVGKEENGGVAIPAVVSEGGRLRWELSHVLAIRRQFGTAGDGRFNCPLPGHTGLARIDQPDDDLTLDGERRHEPRLLCCQERWRSLGEVWAIRAFGTEKLLSNTELAVWTRRLAFDIGAFPSVPVVLPELPPDATSAAQKARAGFALLAGLRWVDGEVRPIAWSVRFCAAWCGLTHWTAYEANHELLAARVIVQVQRLKRVRLYMPRGMA